jgi:2'-5' RNA ligase
MMTEPIRCFIALDLPKDIVEELKKLQKQIEKEGLFTGKFTEDENLHLTLKFLGETSSEKVKLVQERLRAISAKSCDCVIDELGVFSEDFIRIIWARLNGKGVFELQTLIDDVLADVFPKENRFMSHITLVRVKNVKDKEKLIAYLKELKLRIAAQLKTFSLMKSTLTPEGPLYEVIERYTLS